MWGHLPGELWGSDFASASSAEQPSGESVGFFRPGPGHLQEFFDAGLRAWWMNRLVQFSLFEDFRDLQGGLVLIQDVVKFVPAVVSFGDVGHFDPLVLEDVSDDG